MLAVSNKLASYIASGQVLSPRNLEIVTVSISLSEQISFDAWYMHLQMQT